MLACIVGNYNDSFLLANRLAIEAVLAIFNILEDRLLVLCVPADNVYEAGLVAQLAADALFGIEFYTMISVYQSVYPLKIFSLFSALRLKYFSCVRSLKPWASGRD